jgi:hypothetical protein
MTSIQKEDNEFQKTMNGSGEELKNQSNNKYKSSNLGLKRT